MTYGMLEVYGFIACFAHNDVVRSPRPDAIREELIHALQWYLS
jgi:hypothetical protein